MAIPRLLCTHKQVLKESSPMKLLEACSLVEALDEALEDLLNVAGKFKQAEKEVRTNLKDKLASIREVVDGQIVFIDKQA